MMLMVKTFAAARQAALVSVLCLSGAMTPSAFAESVNVLISVPATEKVPSELSDTLASWRRAGIVSDVTRLDHGDAEEHELKSLVILNFESETAYQAWNSGAAQSLPCGVTVRQAKLRVSGGTHSQNREGSHYLVHIHGIPDTPNGLKEYEGFLDGYMKPLLEGQRDAGILLGYRLYIEYEPNGEVGRSIWAAQYRDKGAYEETGPVKRKIREDLIANDPTFAMYRQIYKGLRETLAFYSAHYVVTEAPTLEASN